MSDRNLHHRPGVEPSRRDELRMKLALQAAHAGAWEWEIGSGHTFWSPENYALLGLPPGSGLATYDEWLARVHPDDREWAQGEIARAVETKGDLDFEYRAVWPDGTIRWLRDIGKMMLAEDGTAIGMYGIQIDVTDQRALEERLRRSQRIEAMGLVAGSVAHDFNNLLTVIAGFGDQLRLDPRLHESLVSRVDQILLAAKKAATLTHQLLAFGRRQVLRPQVLDLNRLVGAMDGLPASALGENVEVGFRLAPELGCVWADPGQIEQVLMNLVVNAKDAMPTGGTVTLETFEVDGGAATAEGLPARKPGRYVAVAVHDTGHGMDARTLERIFDPFFTTKPPHRGTGLGLSSVQGIIEQSGGWVTAESAPGRGTRITCYLPRVEQQERPETGGEEPQEPARGHESILVVEDEPAIRQLISSGLESRGYSVASTASAEEALELVARRSTPIDLLVTDVVLPGSSGPTLSARLAELHPGLEVIFVTGYGHAVLGGDAAEAAEIVHKPFSVEDLARRVRDVLARKAEAGK